MKRRATVAVPATSANLGPGYDSFGLALGMYNDFSAELADEWSVDVSGEGSGWLFTDARNKVAIAMSRVFAECGSPGISAAVHCDNGIPTGRGLGSSAAAIVGGMMLANELCGGELGSEGVLRLAIEMEGHPDNVAAAILGGFTISWCDDTPATCHSERFEPGRGLATVVAVPAKSLSTNSSRELLPDTVPHSDAAFNAGRAGLLSAAIISGRGDLLAHALADRLHESYRSPAMPNFVDVRDALLVAGVDGVALSGAGPTVIGLLTADTDEDALERARSVAQTAGGMAGCSGFAVSALPIDRRGAWSRAE
ncbi:MAG: homoserine kinase [Actinomycetota bacterium]|jgi:homoserine kinase|nr:homoserine kinase [Actinomycetota bacterium]